SDLRLTSRQVSVNLKPITASRWFKWDLTYTRLDAREKFNGFTSTVGNPLDRDWGPILQAGHHTVQLGWSDLPISDLLFVSATVRETTGARFTPTIAGDVNGDGSSFNDRAFIFDPTSAD